VQKSRSKELGQAEKEVDGSKENQSWSRLKKMVQGGLGRCPLRKTLWSQERGESRNTILQAIKACKFQDSCYCKRAYSKSKEKTDSTKEKTGSTSR